jgi:RHS repeat-associated protein
MKLIKIISIIVFAVPFLSKAQTLSGEFTNVCVDQEYTYTVGLGAYCVTVNDLNCVGCYDVTTSVNKRSITLKWSPGNISRSVSGTVMCFEPDSPSQPPVQTPIGGNVSLAIGENPFFICEGEMITTKTAFDKAIPESDSRCSDTNIRINLSRDSDYPDFLNKGYPFDRSKTTDHTGIKVEKISTSLGTRAMITLYWKAGWSGDIKVSVEYEKRKWDITDIFGKCETDPWKELVSYTYYRGGNPAGTLSGPSTVVFSGAGVNIDQSYVTSFHGVIPAIKYFINGAEVSEKTSCSGNTSIMGLSYRTTEPGTFNITTQVQDECGRWTDGPTKTVNVYASCYQDNAASVSSTITGNGLVPYPEGYMIVPDEIYSISVSGITDFNNNYEIDFGDGQNDMNIDDNTFSVFKKIGKYDINIVKKPGREICPSVPSIVIFLNGKDETFDKDCAFVLPNDFDEFGFPNIDYGNIVLEHFAGIVKSKRSITVMPGVTLAKGAEIILLVDPPQPQPEDPDLNLNFIQKTTYDGYNRIAGQSRSYITDDGRGTQVQVRNIAGRAILASQTIYDAYDRAAVQTLPAPVNAIKTEVNSCDSDNPVVIEDISFKFAPSFVTALSGDAYDYHAFDRTGDVIKEQNPDPVQGNTPGTLGWYYSTNNGTAEDDSKAMNEPLVAATKYPYSRTLFNEDGSGETISTAAPGDELRAGTKHYNVILNGGIDENDQVIDTYLKFRLKEFNLARPSSLVGNFYRTESVDPNGNKSVAYQDRAGHLVVSMYFAKKTNPITTSYQIYDDANRLIASISPNGINQYNGSNYIDIDKSTNQYNYRGQLVQTKEKDAGTTSFVYRRDGKLRFFQNSEQEKSGRYSYVNYDQAGRPIESGEYNPGNILFNSSEMKSILEITSTGGGLTDGSFSDRLFQYYDLSAEVIAQMGGPSASDLLAEGKTQRFGAGAITCTVKVGVMTSWYSYDELGRIEWLVQDIVGLGLKTLDYKFGATGNVEQVIYQKGKPDQFIHYYEYDQNARLYKAYTTRKTLVFEKTGKLSNPEVLLLQATYFYYLHGPLKRIVYADGIQGIDYSYTASGMLKSINDATKENDPGGDSNDAFGIVLDYYSNDYASNKFNPGSFAYPSDIVDKFSGHIKATRWHSTIENHKPVTYAYRYDERYQLQDAQWGNVQGSDLIFDSKKPYQEYIDSYDANGNLGSLVRKNNNGDEIANFKYHYAINSNQLTTISQQGDPSKILRRYRYDLQGQMTEQEDVVTGSKLKPEYDYSGKVINIRNQDDKLMVSFTYDARGFRLNKKKFDENGAVSVTTWYVRDISGSTVATYEEYPTNSPQLIEVPVYAYGRIGMFKPDYGTFYEVNDHLGNVRAVVAGGIETTMLATMENGRAGRESRDFFGMRTTVAAKDINHTPDIVTIDGQTDHLESNKVVRLNNRPNGQYRPNPVGGGTMLWVHPGDTIRSEVYVKYARNDRGQNRKNIIAFGNVVKSMSPVANAVELKKAFQILTRNDFRALPVWGKLDEAEPPSFLNGLLFDKNMKLQSFDFDQVSSKARINPKNPKSPHEKLELEFVAEKEGYLYIYISNESKEDIDVYFDDLRVIQIYGDIVAGGDYYPYGLEIEDRQVTLEEYRHGYQGQHSERDQETGYNFFELRNYDPVVGRWISSDPYSQHWSPYSGMANDPVNSVDSDGGYSQFGAWWRSGFGIRGDIYQSGYTENGSREVWGFNTADGTSHFGDDAGSYWKTPEALQSQELLDRAAEEGFNQWLSTLSTPDRIMAERGGDGIAPDYTIESFVIPFAKGASLLYNGTVRGVLKTSLNGATRLGGSSARLNYYTLKAMEMGYSTTMTGARVRAGIFVQINHNLARVMQGKAMKTLYSNSAATIIGREMQNQAIGSGLLGVSAGTGSLIYNLSDYYDR